jgi:hypothetical protein
MAKDIERRSIGRLLPGVSIHSLERVPKVYSSGAWQYSMVFLDAVQLVREIANSVKEGDGRGVMQDARQRDPDANCCESMG